MHCFLIILFGTSALWKRVNVCNSSLQDHGMVLGSIPVGCCNPAQTDCVLYHREFYETAGKKVKFKRDAACWFSQICILWQLVLETKDYVSQRLCFSKRFSKSIQLRTISPEFLFKKVTKCTVVHTDQPAKDSIFWAWYSYNVKCVILCWF